MTALLTLENMSVLQGNTALAQHVSMDVQAGEIIGVIGPNGAGKSSLLKALAGLLPYQGRVECAGVELRQMPAVIRAQRIAYVEQHPQVAWPLSVYDVVALGRSARRMLQAEDEAMIAKALAWTDTEPFAHRNVQTLSGGEFARVMLARALATDADMLLLDEPMSGLDLRYQADISACLKTVAATGKTVLVSIHDLNLAARLCHKVLLLNQSEQVGFAPLHQLLNQSVLGDVFGVRLEVLQHGDGAVVYVKNGACKLAQNLVY
jgi:iron complex transport system ATP-binding protein